MKKLILTLAAIVLAVSAFAQDQHLKFKGIPIDGPLNSFVSSLKSQGFISLWIQDGIASLSGTFAGYPQSNVIVVSTNDVVWKVIVTLPEQDTWASVKQRYEEFKVSFETKYKVKPESEETFPGYPNEGSGVEYLAFSDERATWASLFIIPNGYAQLSIKSSIANSTKLQVWIEYYDLLNSDVRERATMEDI